MISHIGKDQFNVMMSQLFENAMEAIFFFNREGKVIAMNPAAQQIVDEDLLERVSMGEEQAICGTCRGYTSEKEVRTCMDCYMHRPESVEMSSFQVFLQTKQGGIEPFTASFNKLDDESGIRVLMLKNLTVQYQTQEKLYQNKMMKHVIEVQENERKRISRELHDGIAQELMSAVVDMRVLKYMTQDESLLTKMQHTEASMTRLLDDIRRLAVELRPATLDDFGLVAAFRSQFKRIEQSYGMTINFTFNILHKRYKSETETVIYRVCQEAVFNAVKYAQVDTVQVSLFEEDDKLQLIVKDEGIGFELGNTPRGTGLGLYGMQERTELVGGLFKVIPILGKGTIVHLQVPIGDGKGRNDLLYENSHRG